MRIDLIPEPENIEDPFDTNIEDGCCNTDDELLYLTTFQNILNTTSINLFDDIGG